MTSSGHDFYNMSTTLNTINGDSKPCTEDRFSLILVFYKLNLTLLVAHTSGEVYLCLKSQKVGNSDVR